MTISDVRLWTVDEYHQFAYSYPLLYRPTQNLNQILHLSELIVAIISLAILQQQTFFC
jgi:hypothetical protein